MRLTWRQRQIVCLMPFLTNRQIAKALGMGYNQVKNHCTAIYKALSVPEYPDTRDKRIAAIVYALRDGEISFDYLAAVATRYTVKREESEQ